MTDSTQIVEPALDQPVAPPLSSLAGVLVGQDAALPLEAQSGALCVSSFGNPARELDALLHSVGLYDLGFRTRISVSGEDKFRWLNGMVTNAVSTLARHHGNYNFILNAQGRIQGDAYVYREPEPGGEAERLVIETDRSQAGRLMEHFDRFIIMDDVELREPSGTVTALGLAGPGAAELLQRLELVEAAELEPHQFTSGRLGGVPVTVTRAYGVLTPRFELWFEPASTAELARLLVESGARAAGLEAWNALRVLEGTPIYGVDINDRNLVQETSQARALNFSKGCYLGQEIVERIRSRTTVHRFLRQLSLSGPAPLAGTELRVAGEERAVGQLTSVATYRRAGLARELRARELPAGAALPERSTVLALGYVRGDAIERKLELEYEGGKARLLDGPPSLEEDDEG